MKTKIVYVCSECGHQSAKWLGKCPTCGEWNTLEEQEEVIVSDKAKGRKPLTAKLEEALPFASLELPEYMRSESGMSELDRVLGGGFVHGSVVLLAGEPGIGKSTLLLQISTALAHADGKKSTVLYTSGEESRLQLHYRAKRLSVECPDLYVMTETDVDRILAECDRLHPSFLIVDSIQTLSNQMVASAPGTVSQVRECTLKLIAKAKSDGMSVIIVGHVNKEGGIAGPKVLEHMVDAVLCFEGDRQSSFRVIRASKNRYGSTNEIGVFEMTDKGLMEVTNPSELLLEGRPVGVSGNCAACLVEGTRPMIAEIQALAAPTNYSAPKRTSNGVDYNRLWLLLAVLERRLGLKFSTYDVYLNVAGGLRPDEPASDLPCCLALISAIKDRPLSDDLIAFGEIGLSGECRGVADCDLRIKEAVRLGFKTIIMPYTNYKKLRKTDYDANIIGVKSLFEALKYI